MTDDATTCKGEVVRIYEEGGAPTAYIYFHGDPDQLIVFKLVAPVWTDDRPPELRDGVLLGNIHWNSRRWRAGSARLLRPDDGPI